MAGAELGAAVLGWDWVMGALASHPAVDEALRRLDWLPYRTVGWSVLWNLAEAQLRAGRSVVLDGVARQEEIDGTTEVAARCGARLVVVVTGCRDRTVHRDRIEGRRRGIPGWHELEWDQVAGFFDHWDEPPGDLRLDSCDELDANVVALRAALASAQGAS
jgi:predicted kinase